MSKHDRCGFDRKAFLSLSVVMMFASAHAVFAQETDASSLPAGWVTTTPTGLIAEPALLRKLVNASDGSRNGGGDGNDGPYVESGNMITGAGWISAGPGYRRHVLDGRAMIDASAAVSWNYYKVAQARFEVPH
ncbi:MAG: hypothetical protein QOI88_3405, partial [Gammaproteobacteria bacterium]|nr:hypothetical protein [Gammaproteobacteria bacterium]